MFNHSLTMDETDVHLPTLLELLQVWESARRQPPFQQALAWLGVALPESTAAEVAQLSLGRRDALLLELRVQLFGSHCQSVAHCPQCRECVELAFSLDPMRGSLPAPDEHKLVVEGYRVSVRAPNSEDLAKLFHDERLDASSARMRLIERCVIEVANEAANDAGPAVVAQLPSTVIAAIAHALAEAEPQTDIQLAVNCPACSSGWTEFFDIGVWLAAEIDDWAQRLLREVHTLALAYHWREADILLLSPSRRRAYLELLGCV